MSNVTLTIGGRQYTVACAAGEEAPRADIGGRTRTRAVVQLAAEDLEAGLLRRRRRGDDRAAPAHQFALACAAARVVGQGGGEFAAQRLRCGGAATGEQGDRERRFQNSHAAPTVGMRGTCELAPRWNVASRTTDCPSLRNCRACSRIAS